MSDGKSAMSSQLSRRLLPLTLVASLTGCSTFFEEADKWAAASLEAEKLAAVKVVAETAPQAPQLPATLEKCLKVIRAAKQPAKPKQPAPVETGKTEPADKLVLTKLKTQDQSRACASAVLKWHDDQRKKVAAQK